jgi:cell division septation protein DedD
MRALSWPVHLLLTHGHEPGREAPVKNPIRNETSLVLVVAVIFSAIAIPVLSGFLEPSQPPAVAAVQIGDPRDDDGGNAARDDGAPARPTESQRQPEVEAETRGTRSADEDDAEPRRPAKRPAEPAPSAQPAPAAPADDVAEDDGGEE